MSPGMLGQASQWTRFESPWPVTLMVCGNLPAVAAIPRAGGATAY